jgi:hypothetical protein
MPAAFVISQNAVSRARAADWAVQRVGDLSVNWTVNHAVAVNRRRTSCRAVWRVLTMGPFVRGETQGASG